MEDGECLMRMFQCRVRLAGSSSRLCEPVQVVSFKAPVLTLAGKVDALAKQPQRSVVFAQLTVGGAPPAQNSARLSQVRESVERERRLIRGFDRLTIAA